MVSWAELLAERNRLVDQANNQPGDDEAHDDAVAALSDQALAIERCIIAADPAEDYVQAIQLQLAVQLWSEDLPLEPAVRTVLEALAAELVLNPLPVFPGPAWRDQIQSQRVPCAI